MAEMLIEQRSIEVDMSFKRVAGPMNEVLFANYMSLFKQCKLVAIKNESNTNCF